MWRCLVRLVKLASVAAAIVTPAAAQTVHLDFDDRAAPSCAFAAAEHVGGQWTPLGVTFAAATPDRAGAIVEQVCSGFDRVSGHSPPNLVGYVNGLTDVPVVMQFTPAVAAVSLLATNWNRVATITLTAYDGLGAVVDTMSISTVGRVGPLQLLAVAGPGIVRAELATTDGSIAFDDLEFNGDAPRGPIVYEATDPSVVVTPANEVGPAAASPFPHTPAGAPALYYQIDDGLGAPALIRLVAAGAGDLLIHF